YFKNEEGRCIVLNQIGKVIIYIGIVLVILGGLIHFFGGAFSWFGRLPGDIRIERENFRFYFPITTMIIISIILNILLRIIRFFLK
ncbi:MAG: DUF2905 domain-containing protein, partial [Halanaerobiaceae bacterium]